MARHVRTYLVAFCALLALLFAASAAQSGFIRDAEIEHLLRDYTDPLLREAGLQPSAIDIGLISDSNINAFVANGQNIYFFTGLITEADTPNVVIGVIAHEIGHIVGGHLARSSDAMAKAGRPMLIGAILGLGSILAGSPDLGLALLTGGQQLGQASFLTYSRAQEASADQVALRLLEGTEQSAQGIIDLMDHFAGQEILSEVRQDPYIRSHPMSRDRVSFYQANASSSEYFTRQDTPELQFRHDMAKAKLVGFIDHPQSVLRAYREPSPMQLYAHAIAYHRLARTDDSLKAIDQLIAQQPDNPWFHELKGQILYESGDLDAAIPPYRKSNKLAANEPLLMIGLASALLASDQKTGEKEKTREAVKILRNALRIEPENPTAYHQLSKSYGQLEDIGMAEWALAEAYATQRDPQAIMHAHRAIKLLPPGKAERTRAQDIAASEFKKR
jgi:predicted Zn-dependent protease